MRRRYRKRITVTILSVILIAIIGITYFKIIPKTGDVVKEIEIEKEEEGISIAENPFDITRFKEVKIDIIPSNILLADNCTAIVMTTSRAKTFSIKRGVDKEIDLRPNEHDLIYDVIDNFDIEVVMAKVQRMENNFYYADLILRKGSEILTIDSKPSDAISIATRFDKPVYVNEELFNKVGQKIC